MTNLEDGSGYLKPAVEWNPGGRVKLGLTAFLTYGSNAAEFGVAAVQRSVAASVRLFF